MLRAWGAASVAALTFALAGAPAGFAAVTSTTNPLTGFPSAPVTTAPQTQTAPVIANSSTGTAGSSSFSGGSAIAVAIGALVILGGISLFIWRDARRRAPVKSAAWHGGVEDSHRAGSKAPPKQRKLSPAERRRRKRGRARR